ncbi:MAG: WbqC family protein [Calditrichia bacterium]
MIVAANTPMFLPPLSFFIQWAFSDRMILAENTQFVKHAFHNRSLAISENGPLWLTVPVLTKGMGKQLIRDIQINQDVNWQRKIKKALANCYSKSSFYDFYSDLLFDLIDRPWQNLLDLNLSLIKTLGGIWNIETELQSSTQANIQWDDQEKFAKRFRELNATTYLADPAHKNYLSPPLFKRYGVELKFVQFPKRLPEASAPAGVLHWLFNYGPELQLFLKKPIPTK